MRVTGEVVRFAIGVGATLALAVSAVLAQAPPPAGGPATQFPPSPPEVVSAMLKLAGVTKGDVVYDLGSGDGRIPIAAARLGARAVGVELAPELVTQAVANAEKEGVSGRVRFIQRDFFETDIREATVVTLYLLPSLNARLLPKLNKELKPGTRVVSQSFDLGGPKPKTTIDVSGRPVYLWVVPIR
jgi:protein-L-isoaspartate O-methyltransferase